MAGLHRRWSWRSGDVAIWSMLLFFFMLAVFIVYTNMSLTAPPKAPEKDGRLKSQ